MTQPALSHDASPDQRSAFAADVRSGLTHAPQKELPSKYLYDEVGSALFEVITVLPEYGVTRARRSGCWRSTRWTSSSIFRTT